MLPKKIIDVSSIILLVIISFVCFANSMLKPLSRDENMYCSAGVLIADGKAVYKDFSYVAQMPYHPLLLAAVYKVTNTTYFLLTARIISTLSDILTGFFIILIIRRLFSAFPLDGLLFALLSIVLYLFNPFVDYANGYGWNHDLVTLLVIISLWLCVSAHQADKTPYFKIAISSALLSFATFMRPTFIFVQIIFYLFFIYEYSFYKKWKIKKILLSILLPALAVSAWPIYLFAQAPDAFLIDTIKMPLLNSQLLHKIGMTLNKPQLFYFFLLTPTCIFSILTAIYLYTVIFLNRRQIQSQSVATPLLFVLLPLVFLATAFIPPTIWPQYFSAPVIFLILSLAWPLSYLKKISAAHYKIALSIIFFTALISVMEYPEVLKRMPGLFTPEKWTPLRLHNLSLKICSNADKSKPVLTLAPLYAIEGSCKIYPQFSAGSFAYRIADRLSEKERKITSTAAPATLKNLVENNPPALVLTGTETPEFKYLEETLLLPVNSGWRKNDVDGLSIYINPADL